MRVRHPENSPLAAVLRNATKRYGSIVALDGINLEIRKGEVLALLGPNGAGKTTAVRLILGLSRSDTGQVEVFGRSPLEAQHRMRTGAMMQIGKVPETLRVAEHIDLFSSYYVDPLPRAEIMARAGLTGIEQRKFGELSGGQKQRLLFALAICGNPDLLVLDEPSAGLDVESRRLLWDQIRRLVHEGRSILLTTHYLEEADALADRVVVIDRGKILAEGTPAEIKKKASGKRIRCSTLTDAGRIAGIPGVTSVERDEDTLVILASAAEPVVRELLTLDASLTNLEVDSAGLEEAFLSLTRTNAQLEVAS